MRRNVAIASALTRDAPGAAVLLVTGSCEAERLGLDSGADVLKLPTVQKIANDSYLPRRLPVARGDLTVLRARQIDVAVRTFRPVVMLVDKHPAGIAGELIPALRTLEEQGGHAVAGFRDILDEPGQVQREWRAGGTLQVLARSYSAVLIYGQPQITDFRATYEFPDSLARRSVYTGYVVHRVRPRHAGVDALPVSLLGRRTRPVVVATAGGGEDGGRLLHTFIASARLAPWKGIVVAGSEIDGDVSHSLRRAAVAAGVEYHGFALDLQAWLREADAVLSMGGYNTLAEVLRSGTPTVCVPRVGLRVEQLIRARLFARLGLLEVLEPHHLRPASLADAIARALGTDRRLLAARVSETIDFDGARRAAAILHGLARNPSHVGMTRHHAGSAA